MNAYAQSCEVERTGRAILMPYLDELADGRVVLTNKGTLARWLQESVGDAVVQTKEEMYGVEFKFEQRHTGNIFLETWSNRNLESRANHARLGQTMGWMHTLRTDLLLVYFLDTDMLYSFNFLSLKRWFFGVGERRGFHNKSECVIKPARHSHPNDTWGACVPVELLRDALPPGAMKYTRVRQRSLATVATECRVPA